MTKGGSLLSKARVGLTRHPSLYEGRTSVVGAGVPYLVEGVYDTLRPEQTDGD